MKGTRRFTDGLAHARELAEKFDPNPLTSRVRCLGALKRAAPAIGLSLRHVALVDMLFATSEDQDWQTPGIRPVVWPSNDWLCEQTGLSLTSLRRHLRALVDLGLIVPADSANGKRWGRRSDDGRLIAAYGFDLSPIAVRYTEFVELAAGAQAQRARRKELEREFTILRRTVAMIITAAEEQGLPGPWSAFARDLGRIIQRRSQSLREELINELLDLRIAAEDAFNEASKARNQEPKGAKNGTHILTTTDRTSRNSKEQRSGAYAPQVQVRAGSAGKGFPRKPVAKPRQVQQDSVPDRGGGSEIESIPLGLVKDACPEIVAYSTRPLATWRDLFELACLVRQWIGISEHAWNEARNTLGDNLAAVAIAVILEKQRSGDVAKPGGYLRGMVGKALMGELHVARTLYGLSDRAGHVH